MVIKTYKGDTFRNLIRQYSFDRMGYDPTYRRAVRKAKAERKAAKAAKVSNEKASPDTGSSTSGVSSKTTPESQAS